MWMCRARLIVYMAPIHTLSLSLSQLANTHTHILSKSVESKRHGNGIGCVKLCTISYSHSRLIALFIIYYDNIAVAAAHCSLLTSQLCSHRKLCVCDDFTILFFFRFIIRQQNKDKNWIKLPINVSSLWLNVWVFHSNSLSRVRSIVNRFQSKCVRFGYQVLIWSKCACLCRN